MGFERVAAVMQSTKSFTDFSKPASNYDTDVFSPIFSKIEDLSGKVYSSTLPEDGKPKNEQEQIDIAFRVIADHLRALSFSIADGILPGNNDRNYVLRRILRRAVKYGRTLGFTQPFFHKLAPVLIDQMGETFPELNERSSLIENTLKSEEVSFNKTLDRGIELFNRETKELPTGSVVSGEFAFKLYDTFGFPVDLTDLMARESGLSINHEEFESQMEAQRKRARDAHKSVDILVSENGDSSESTVFCGYEPANLTNFSATCTDVIESEGKSFLVSDKTPFYAEMGGQVGDTGKIQVGGSELEVENVIKDSAGRFLHQIKNTQLEKDWTGSPVTFDVNLSRRKAIQQHHTATHILHWALREVLGDHVRQAGSLVQPDRLRFDFSHFEALSEDQIKTIERISNERILQNDDLNSYEVPFSEKPDGVIAFLVKNMAKLSGLLIWVDGVRNCAGVLMFGLEEKSARFVCFLNQRFQREPGDWRQLLDMPHTTGQVTALIGLLSWFEALGAIRNSSRIESNISSQPARIWKKGFDPSSKKDQAGLAEQLIQAATDKQGIKIIAKSVDGVPANELRGLASQVNKRTDPSVVLLASENDEKCSLICICSEGAMAKGYKAGEIIKELALQIGGKGGGKPDFAMGGGIAGKGVSEAIAKLSMVA